MTGFQAAVKIAAGATPSAGAGPREWGLLQEQGNLTKE
jgi:hypothetical protein